MKPNEENWTKAEIMQMLLAPRPKPAPKPAVVKAEERWSDKPLSAVLQDARRAEAAATEKLKREREERSAQAAAQHLLAYYQAEIDAAWQRSAAYRAELAEWRSGGCHRGPGDSDWGL
jgi:hypothetical protein